MKKRIRAALGHPRLLLFIDRLLFTVGPATNQRSTFSLLIAPPGAGNIGDQAMIEAYLENTPGDIRIICHGQQDIIVPDQHIERTRVIVLPGLIYGHLIPHVRSIGVFRRLLGRAQSLAITGADIMDGAYNWQASTNRANIAWLAAQAGVAVRILGFSWNGQAHPQAVTALRRATAAGVQLCLRDPLSAERARADGLANVTEVADIVFAARTVNFATASRLLYSLPAHCDYALVNASGLIGRTQGQIDGYVRIIRELQHQGLQVILLPHVSRPGGDDLPVCQAIHQALKDPQVVLVDQLLSPSEIRGLTASATLTVTGRMHLAIMSLYSGVPAITLATQGKVEGMMRLFGAEFLCIEPRPDFADRVITVAQQILSRPDDLRQHLHSKLPAVRRLASRNFDSPQQDFVNQKELSCAYD
ncbi:polysaccharide pyruvyl transferase family protein [Halopseudomonas bauzanensis]|uniref:Polysaccharide pyruvyl transferase domain-containing protein n=1 Tax=Halopseudomonas bauzanensis TaxID=653930 RepID=A0A4U0YEC1_9GAMM|nr:polysaccharide pyruvyl transferase family protein [Halopseudomonas bauzanensis]TKA90180.1 hypothetical protein FA869_13710 [Halopseudomonas bauzanensis]